MRPSQWTSDRAREAFSKSASSKFKAPSGDADECNDQAERAGGATGRPADISFVAQANAQGDRAPPKAGGERLGRHRVLLRLVLRRAEP